MLPLPEADYHDHHSIEEFPKSRVIDVLQIALAWIVALVLGFGFLLILVHRMGNAFACVFMALQRMAPGSMVTKWTTVHGDGARRQRCQRSLAIGSDETDVQLHPGQTRIRRAENPKQVWEIKGDSESSSDEHSSVAEQQPEDTTLQPLMADPRTLLISVTPRM